MSSHIPPAPADERRGRTGEALALELIELLGVEGARRMCREHNWDGLATVIDTMSVTKAAA